eukprot:2715986-Lingulodinium_polyedra.AAC.1
MALSLCLCTAITASVCSPARSRAHARALGTAARDARGLPTSSQAPTTLPAVGNWWPCPTAAMAK